MKHRIEGVLLLVGCSLCAWGQGTGDGPPGTGASRPAPYAGGGIRGVLAPVPDGVLVTGAEARDFMGEAGFSQDGPRTRSLVPTIEILQPQPGTDRKVATTFSISLRFRSPADAAMVPSTLKVLYGANRVDITSRIVKPGQVTPEGFSAGQVQVPPGKHLLVFRIEDERQRVTEVELLFEAE
jgi:hypothetical protein